MCGAMATEKCHTRVRPKRLSEALHLPKTPSFRLDGRRALVTGAGRGIGLALAAALADAGAKVALVARTTAEIEAGASAIGNDAEAAQLDVSDLAAVRKLLPSQ